MHVCIVSNQICFTFNAHSFKTYTTRNWYQVLIETCYDIMDTEGSDRPTTHIYTHTHTHKFTVESERYDQT